MHDFTTRRHFLQNTACGLGTIALADLLAGESRSANALDP
jgi:hypothetical protein